MTDFWSLIDTAGLAALDRGPRPGVATPADLRQATLESVRGLAPETRAAALGLALLWHDDLDGAHELCQAHEGHQGCDYVHALLHRREGDFANAKYWFRAVGRHAVHDELAQTATTLGQQAMVTDGRWNPARMVDACARALTEPPPQRLVVMQVQAAEFRALGCHLTAALRP